MAQSKTIRKAVIPAAGKGTRLQPLTNIMPKEMLPIGRKPVLEIIMDEIVSTGITDVLLVISEAKMSVPSYFKNYPGLNVEWTIQKEQKGLADAILCSEEYVGDDPFLVVLGDSIITQTSDEHSTCRVLKCFEETDAEAVIVVQSTPLEDAYRFGIVHPKSWDNDRFEIDFLIEKPKPEETPSEYAIAGRYAFTSRIFDYIRKTKPGAGGELQITDSISLILQDNKPVWCVPLVGEETRRDIGTFPSYYEAFMLECLNDPECGMEILRALDGFRASQPKI